LPFLPSVWTDSLVFSAQWGLFMKILDDRNVCRHF
jgi:hypothetical protein